MLLRFLCVTGVSVIAMATVARAADDATMKLGVEYRASIKHDDHGLEKRTGGPDPVKTTNIDLHSVKLNAEGAATKDVDYRVRFNTLGALELGYVNLKLTPMVSFLMGRYKVREGGFEGRNYGYDTVAGSDYFGAMPFGIYSDMAQVQLNMDFGTISVQLLDDVVAPAGFNTANKQPAFIVEWLGSFGDWTPLVQLGSYDMNHSMYFVVGVSGTVSGLGLSLDYVNDQRAIKAGTKELTDTHTNINIAANYKMASFTPWLKVSMYNVAESTDSAARPKAAEANGLDPATGAAMFNNNGQTIQIGADCTAYGSAYVPYAAVVMHSGEFQGTDVANPAKKETLSNMTMEFGVHGKF